MQAEVRLAFNWPEADGGEFVLLPLSFNGLIYGFDAICGAMPERASARCIAVSTGCGIDTDFWNYEFH